MNSEVLPTTGADSPAADGSIFLITDSRSTELELPTQSALHVSSSFYAQTTLSTPNPNCFHLDFGSQPHQSTMKTFANHANPGDEQVGSITCKRAQCHAIVGE